jgi:DNA helicase-2/ATP-dependent DNA helicase PcrA
MASDDDLLGDLTDEQRAAVTHGEGPLLILAGAGSGKTRVITRRVAYLLRQGVKPWSILAITFTNKAAGEMRARVEALVPGNRVWVSTFHSLGARLLRQYSDRLNLDKNFTVYDVDDRNKLVRDAMAVLDLEEGKFTPERLAGAISKAKNQLLTPGQYEKTANDYFSRVVSQVYPAYEKRLRAANGMDFDDLLYLPAMALIKNEEFRKDLDARFRYVLIDEYQDTNLAQYEVARRLSRDHPNLCVVGDPDQSIYKWRGSDIKNILDFERDYPTAKVITLARNYRSTKGILYAASTLIARNTQRKKKSLITDNASGEPVRIITFDNGLDEAEGVVMRIRKAVDAGNFKYRDHAIFLRINALSRTLESAFVKHGVPFQIVKGLAFYERKENKDVLAYLRLLVNPQDTVSFLRAVNEPARGIGKVSLDKLSAYADKMEISLFAAAGQVAMIPDIRGKAATGLRDFFQLLTELRAQMDQPPHELINTMLAKSGYRKMLESQKDDEEVDRLANVEEVITAARQFYEADPDRTLADFLEQVALAADVDGWDEDADRVSVMTLHSSKGLEFPVVYLLAVEEGLLPHQRSAESNEELEEERRLCFVGMTRAMKELYLCHARMREFRGQVRYCVESSFLRELPPEVERIDSSQSRNYARSGAEEYRARIAPATPDWAATSEKPAASNATAGQEEELARGVVVMHDEYGIGTVGEVTGYGAMKRVKIRFPSSGEKVFVASKVKLRIVTKKS